MNHFEPELFSGGVNFAAAIAPDMSMVGTALEAVGGGIVDGFGAIADSGAVSAVGGALGDAAGAVGGVAADAGGAIGGVAMDAGGAIGGVAMEAGGAIGGVASFGFYPPPAPCSSPPGLSTAATTSIATKPARHDTPA